MFYIRTTKTSSGSTAVQVVRYEDRKKIIVAHIGSAHTKEEILALKRTANVWIEKQVRQSSLLPLKSESRLISIDKCQYLGVKYLFVYEILNRIFTLFKFHLFNNQLLTDLVLMRIVEPASKLRSLELLEQYFGIRHSRQAWYRCLPEITGLKDKVENKVLAIAKKQFGFDFSLVFYDVTTLYFESFEQDDLRKPGFSKDNKHNQPQILIGLVVDNQGFPVACEIFEGSKFEGHTLIPVIKAFKKRHKIKNLTIVADAAMLSLDNIDLLEKEKLNYIVGARTGNLPLNLIKEISLFLNSNDKASLRLSTKHGQLIGAFSAKRYRKDKHEMEKQIKKAENAIKSPNKIKKMKFVENNNAKYQLNAGLVEKTKLLLGIKGYYTNLPADKVDNDDIINHYHNLWHVEQAFRITKSDLQIRPMYHFKKEAIQAHVLICFMALAVSKYMEIKSSKSLKKMINLLKSITDATILDKLSGKKFILRSEINEEIKDLLKKIGVWY